MGLNGVWRSHKQLDLSSLPVMCLWCGECIICSLWSQNFQNVICYKSLLLSLNIDEHLTSFSPSPPLTLILSSPAVLCSFWGKALHLSFHFCPLSHFSLRPSLLPFSRPSLIILSIYLSVFFCVCHFLLYPCCFSSSHLQLAVSAVSWVHYVVVAAGDIELCAAGGGHHILPDHRETLQGVQREVPEASGTLGQRQQTEGWKAEERLECLFLMHSLESCVSWFNTWSLFFSDNACTVMSTTVCVSPQHPTRYKFLTQIRTGSLTAISINY